MIDSCQFGLLLHLLHKIIYAFQFIYISIFKILKLMDAKFDDDPILAEYRGKRRFVINEKLKRCKEFKDTVMRAQKNAYLRYRQNTPKQELVLEHVIQYKKQFQQHMNEENETRELFLYPKNQCDVYKFICTTIRPTKLGFLQLHNYVDCAKKISKFIQYEELDPPDQFPKCIPSPANVAEWQKGDCFDMSILLTSLLIGVGYDAYCVYGIAPKQITTKNQALMECPFLQQLRQNKSSHTQVEQKQDKQDSLIPKRVIQSAYQKNLQQQERQQKQQLQRKALTIDDDEPDELNPDLYLGRRVHCWVLVKKGKMDVTEDKFIEPSTGKIYDIKKSPYLLVDAVFNNQNFFIQMEPKHKVDEINFDFASMSWEYIMFHDDIFRNIGEEEHHEMDDNSFNKISEQDQKLKFLAQTLDMPPPWSPKIYIDKDKYLKGTRLGEQTTFYIKVKVQKYSDYTQPDGLITKYTLFDDYKKIKIKEIGYIYDHRTDKLERKYRYPYQFKTVQLYGPGKMPHWKQVIQIDRRLRKITYYPNRNNDGLIQRIQKIGQQTIEKYQNRDDRIVLRSCTFTTYKQQAQKISASKNYTYIDNHIGKVVILKVTQKFQKDEKKPPHQQISKFSVDFVKEKVTVFYHMEDGQIQPIKRQYSRDQIQGFGKIDANDKKVDDPLIQQENQKLLAMEKDFYQFIKIAEATASDEYKNIRNEPPKIEKTLYDKARQKFKQSKSKVQDQTDEQDANDFLKPFLQKMGESSSKQNVLDPDKAAKVKAEVMNKMKQRIKQRAKIIQARLQKQQDQLKTLQQQYQKKQQEKNEKQLSEVKFKISILQSRAIRFEATALKKFQDMDQKLDEDPRLARLKEKK